MTINQNKPHNPFVGQILYMGRWVDKKNFRAFVYDTKGEQKLAENYEEFNELTSSGAWFESKEAVDKHKIESADGYALEPAPLVDDNAEDMPEKTIQAGRKDRFKKGR